MLFSKWIFVGAMFAFFPGFSYAQSSSAGPCEHNLSQAKNLADSGIYVAALCLGSSDSTDPPARRATHATNDVTKLVRCPDGIVGAVCFQRRQETLAYACASRDLPSVTRGYMNKTPDGCEKDQSVRGQTCRVFTVLAWRISCPAIDQPANPPPGVVRIPAPAMTVPPPRPPATPIAPSTAAPTEVPSPSTPVPDAGSPPSDLALEDPLTGAGVQ